VRFDGPLHQALAASFMEVLWSDESRNFYTPLIGVPTGTFLNFTLNNVPVGIRQTVLARISVNSLENSIMYPEGLFSPWAAVIFRIPRISNFPPNLIYEEQRGLNQEYPFICLSSSITECIDSTVFREYIMSIVEDDATPDNELTLSFTASKTVSFFLYNNNILPVIKIAVLVLDAVNQTDFSLFENTKTLSFNVFIAFRPIQTSIVMSEFPLQLSISALSLCGFIFLCVGLFIFFHVGSGSRTQILPAPNTTK
jgi:hypothetical protein